MSERYDELRVVYVTAKAKYDRLDGELAVARAEMRAAERDAIAEWRKLTDVDRLGSCTNSALSSTDSEAPR